MPLETIAKQTQEAPVEGQLVVKDEKPTPMILNKRQKSGDVVATPVIVTNRVKWL